MAKIVIGGAADCPYYARAELLGDNLQCNLPNFQLHKISVLPEEWPEWLDETCRRHGWKHTESPIVWRELIDRGGKGVLIGGANEFQEYVAGYYNVFSDLTGDDQMAIAMENVSVTKELDDERKERLARITPVKICVTGVASSPACTEFLGCLARGETLGSETTIHIHLLESEDNLDIADEIKMETMDLAGPVLLKTVVTADIEAAFSDCAFVILNVDELVQGAEENREEFLSRAHDHFRKYMHAIEGAAKPDVRVAVVGMQDSPVNFIANAILRSSAILGNDQVVAVPQIVENSAKGVISSRLKLNSLGIENVIVWGSINGTHMFDTCRGLLYEYDSAIWAARPFHVSLEEMIHDDDWLKNDFSRLADERRRAVEGQLGRRAVLSAGDAISTLIRLWSRGAETDEQLHSLAVASQGWYGIPEGLVFSVPVKFSPPGYFTVIEDWELSENVKARIPDIVEELECDLETIYPNPEREYQRREMKARMLSAKRRAMSSENKLEQSSEVDAATHPDINAIEPSDEINDEDAVVLDKINEEQEEVLVEQEEEEENVDE